MSRIFILLITLCAASVTWAQNKIILNTHEQAPLTYLNEENVLAGTAVKPVTYALNKMGWSYEFQVMPWTRAQRMVEIGQVDGFFAGSKNPERDSYAVNSAPIAFQVINWYLLRTNPLDPNSKDFKQKATVGGYLGANMLKWLKANDYNVKGEPPDADKLFLMLNTGRFDACLANEYNYKNFIIKHKELENRFRWVLQQKNELYVYFSKSFIAKNPNFLAEFNKHVSASQRGQSPLKN